MNHTLIADPAIDLLKLDIQNIRNRMIFLDRAQYVLQLQEKLDTIGALVRNVQCQMLSGNPRMYPTLNTFLDVAVRKIEKVQKQPISMAISDKRATLNDLQPSDVATELAELDQDLTNRQTALLNLSTLKLAESVGNADTILARSGLALADVMDWSPNDSDQLRLDILTDEPSLSHEHSEDLDQFAPFMAPHQGPGF